jgi:hypothetical protein
MVEVVTIVVVLVVVVAAIVVMVEVVTIVVVVLVVVIVVVIVAVAVAVVAVNIRQVLLSCTRERIICLLWPVAPSRVRQNQATFKHCCCRCEWHNRNGYPSLNDNVDPCNR